MADPNGLTEPGHAQLQQGASAAPLAQPPLQVSSLRSRPRRLACPLLGFLCSLFAAPLRCCEPWLVVRGTLTAFAFKFVALSGRFFFTFKPRSGELCTELPGRN